MNWISVKDKLPAEMQRVLAYCKEEEHEYFILMFYLNNNFCICASNSKSSKKLNKYITHWMELPEPPK